MKHATIIKPPVNRVNEGADTIDVISRNILLFSKVVN